jgi:hypothetical protein
MSLAESVQAFVDDYQDQAILDRTIKEILALYPSTLEKWIFRAEQFIPNGSHAPNYTKNTTPPASHNYVHPQQTNLTHQSQGSQLHFLQ